MPFSQGAAGLILHTVVFLKAFVLFDPKVSKQRRTESDKFDLWHAFRINKTKAIFVLSA